MAWNTLVEEVATPVTSDQRRGEYSGTKTTLTRLSDVAMTSYSRLHTQLSEFDPVADPLTINLNNNRLERNSCCGDDDKSDNGLDSTQSISEMDGEFIPVRKYKAPKSRRDA